MTRSRKKTGRITIIGAGPGDPGLLTRRAIESLVEAEHIVYDPDVPEGLLEAVLAYAPEAETSVAEGEAGDIAKVTLSGARSGRDVARVVLGDPMSSDVVIKEAMAVARTAVPLEIIPAVPSATGVASFAGVAPGSVHSTIDARDIAAADFSAATGHGTQLVLARVDDLAAVRDGLLAAGVPASTAVMVTGGGTTDTQSSGHATLDDVMEAAVGLTGEVVVLFGVGLRNQSKLSWWESRPLFGWRVLVPRTKEQAGAMSTRLRGWGAQPAEVPTIAVEPPRTPAQMERAVKGLVTGRYEWVVFTSTNAVRAIREKFEEFGLDARAFAGVKIACVGAATAAAIEEFGIKPELVPAGESSSAGLLEEFPPYDSVLDPIDRVLLPRADIATETLAAGLIERGWEVDDVTAYRTVRAAPPAASIRDAIKSGGFDAVLFTSSSTVRNLIGIAGKPHARTVIACIGPKTVETAEELGLRVDVKGEEATVDSLVTALADYAADLATRLADLPPKQRRGAKVQGPTGGRSPRIAR